MRGERPLEFPQGMGGLTLKGGYRGPMSGGP